MFGQILCLYTIYTWQRVCCLQADKAYLKLSSYELTQGVAIRLTSVL